MSNWFYQSPHQSLSNLRPPNSVQPPWTQDCKHPSPSEGLWTCFLLPECSHGLIPSWTLIFISPTGGFLWTPISSSTNILSCLLDTYHPFNSCFSPANHDVPKDVWVFCWPEQSCSWVTSLSFILCLAEGSESTHSEWVDWFCPVFQTQVPSDVGVWNGPSMWLPSSFSAVLFLST